MSIIAITSIYLVSKETKQQIVDQRALLAHQKKTQNFALLKRELDNVFLENSDWPEKIEINEDKYDVEYSFDSRLTDFVENLLKRHRSDYSAIVVIENDTGKILAAVGHERKGNQLNRSLAFSSTHPAASLIKIVTSADLLENTPVDLATEFTFRGRGTTLYRSQIETPKNRATNKQTLERAFAYSNNVIFGRAAIRNSSNDSLFKMATDFGFNQDIMNDISLTKSVFHMPTDDYNLAELASGFNRETLISPIHASVLAAIVANNGVRRAPRIIESVRNRETGEELWLNDLRSERVFSSETADSLRKLMQATTKSGTARGAFRQLPKRMSDRLEIGGKTGSITGGMPFGRRDWFVAYAKPDMGDKRHAGISIAVMNVNVNKWYVKSTFLAREVVRYYYSQIDPLDEMTLASGSDSVKKNKNKVEL